MKEAPYHIENKKLVHRWTFNDEHSLHRVGFDGLMNDIRIYNSILTAKWISQLYTSEKHRYNG